MYKALNTGPIGVKADFPQAVEYAAKFGFKGVYFNPSEILRIGVAKAKSILENHYLKAAGFGLPVQFRRDDAEFQKGIKGLPQLAEAAAGIGCTRCSTWISPGSNDLTFQENFEIHRKRLGHAARILDQNGIRLGLEFVGPKTSRASRKYEFIWNAEGMLKLCKATGANNVGLLLDSWHWYTSGGTVDDFAKWNRNTVIDVHVNDAPRGVPVDQQKDNVRAMPGETGVINIKGFLQGLRKLQYDGPVMVEPFSQRVRDLPTEKAIQATKDSLDKIWKIAGMG